MPHGKPFARASGQDHSTGRAVGTNKFAHCMLLAAKICATFRPNNQVLESLEPLTRVGWTIAPKPFAWSSRRHCTWGASSMFGQPLVFPILPCDEALYVFRFLSKRTTNSTTQKCCRDPFCPTAKNSAGTVLQNHDDTARAQEDLGTS